MGSDMSRPKLKNKKNVSKVHVKPQSGKTCKLKFSLLNSLRIEAHRCLLKLRLNCPALPVQNWESTNKKAKNTARTDRQSDKLCLMSTLKHYYPADLVS